MKEEKTELDKLMESIEHAEMPNRQDFVDLYNMMRAGTLQRCLHLVLVESDMKLALVGMGDLADEKGLKALIKTQGEAIGLARAVEYLAELATNSDSSKKENNNVA